MRYVPNLIVPLGGMLMLFLGMTNSHLPRFVLFYMMLGGTVFIVFGLIMFIATLREQREAHRRRNWQRY